MSPERPKYIYGPVRSWRSGCSLGIDPIGETSTCSFNCAYCQLGKIQNITTEIKDYVATEDVLNDLREFEEKSYFQYSDLDIITFAGSGEPTIAKNLDKMIRGINEIQEQRIKEGKLKKRVPISILTNATMFNDPEVIKKASQADEISLKLDAPNNDILKSLNQPAEGVSIESITGGIKKLKESYKGKLKLQIMFMPKFLIEANYIKDLSKLISDTGVEEIQINTPTRPRPLGSDYHIETRGNHPYEEHNSELEDYESVELPVISKEEAFSIEDQIREHTSQAIPNLKVINVYKR